MRLRSTGMMSDAPRPLPAAAAPSTPAARPKLRALDVAGLEALVVSLGQPKFRGRQIYGWLWQKGARSFDAMTDLPKTLRERLAAETEIGTPEIANRQVARDGTVKLLLTLASGRQVETVVIPDFEHDADEDGEAPSARRVTVCVSSQVGCAMGCAFCATGTMGFRQNLDPGEIASQVLIAREEAEQTFGRGLTNVVFMGMGEPLQNTAAVTTAIGTMTHPNGLGMGARRITVSTVGLARRIREMADAGARFGLAVSLHAPTDAKRSSIMPVNRSEATDLAALRSAIQHWTRTTGRRVTYEYCLFDGFNDTDEDARNLAKVAAWAPSKVNLILYNSVEGSGFRRTPEERVEAFIRVLVSKGVTVTVRRSRGQDIDAACGQLAVKADAAVRADASSSVETATAPSAD